MTAEFSRAFDLVASAVERRLVPGAALGIVRRGAVPEVQVWGDAQREDTVRPLQREHYFDLASLTKVLFTVPAVLKLVEHGRADLYDPLGRHLPELAWLQGSELPGRTLWQLLTHTSGLPAWHALYSWSSDPTLLRQRLLQERWPLGESVYSDLGYLYLGLVLERHLGPLTQQPIPPGFSWAPPPELSVATQRCPWREAVMCGRPDDENADAFKGAGHAGLFATVDGVLGQLGGWLEGSLLSAASLAVMRRPATPTRALGWERAHPNFSGGSLCSPTTLGHTGFTGTAAYVDFDQGLAWVLLTNAVHPSRPARPNLHSLRQAVGNVLSAMNSSQGAAQMPISPGGPT